MSENKKRSSPPGIGVSLVDGDPAVRHARQLMLGSQDYAVRSYPDCAALLADPQSRNYPCIILGSGIEHKHSVDLLKQMRASGWRGKALRLEGSTSTRAMPWQTDRHGDKILLRDVGDEALLAAIDTSIDHGWAGWNAV